MTDAQPLLTSDLPWEDKKALHGWVVLFVATLVLYALTANRGAQWQDSGEEILRVVTAEPHSPFGLALSHPLHHWLGRLLVRPGWVEPCLAVTLLSALAGAIAVANTYGCALALTRSFFAAVLAAVSLGLANTFWRLATVTETYTLTTALLAGECWCLVLFVQTRRRGFAWGMALLNGVGIANHLVATLTTPIVVVVLWLAARRKELSRGAMLIALGLWLLGSLPYSGMVIAELGRSGDFAATIRSALFGQAYMGKVFHLALTPRFILIGLAFVVLNFPHLLLPAAIHGLTGAKRVGVPRLTRRALMAALIVHGCFALRYDVPDRFLFFLPTYLLLALWAAVGFARLPHWAHDRARRIAKAMAVVLIALTPVVYLLVPPVARKLHVLREVQRHKPYRDDYVYLFTPWSVAETSAERMSRQAVTLAGRNGLILVEDRMASFAVRYHKWRRGCDGLEIRVKPNLPLSADFLRVDRPVVLVPMDITKVPTDPPGGSWKAMGNLYLFVRN